jgi:serine/threonine protein kinase
LCSLHLASIESSKTRSNYLLKMARDSKDNDLLVAEQKILEKIRSEMKARKSKWPETIPEIKESFLMDDGRTRRRINVMKPFDGFYTAEEIRRRLPKGINGDPAGSNDPGRTIGWMWKRLLGLLDWTTNCGFVHGAILPPHVMYFPDSDSNDKMDVRRHSIRLVDWCYAVDYEKRTRLSAWVPEYKDFYAPEILEKKKLGPYTDLYMGAKTMLYLVGAKWKSSTKVSIPPEVPVSIQKSILSCIRTDPAHRPQNIDAYKNDFTKILEKEYGASKYHNFVLPGA